MKRLGATFIYFIAPIGGGHIKIGCSYEPINRLDTLMSWSPYRLEILATARGTTRDERAIHGAFIQHWSHSEWFRSAPEIYALINEIRSTGEIPIAFKGCDKQPKPEAMKANYKRSPEQCAHMRKISKERWDGIRAARKNRAAFEALILQTGMSDADFDKSAGIVGLAATIRRESTYRHHEAARAIALFRAALSQERVA